MRRPAARSQASVKPSERELCLRPGIHGRLVSKFPRACSPTRPRAAFLPDVPTMTELGYPDVMAGSWFGVFAPAGVSQDIIRRLAKELGEIAESDEFAAQMSKFSAEKSVALMDEFARQTNVEREIWRSLARQTNLKLTD